MTPSFCLIKYLKMLRLTGAVLEEYSLKQMFVVTFIYNHIIFLYTFVLFLSILHGLVTL